MLAILNKIPIWIKAILSVFSLLGAIYVGINNYNKKIILKADKERIEAERWETLDSFQKDVYSFIEEQREVNNKQEMFNLMMDEKSDKSYLTLGNLKNYMEKKAANKDDLLEVVKVWEDYEKKNGY